MGNAPNRLRPEALGELAENTDFSEDEIRKWYKEFLTDFPDGHLSIDQFKDIYVQHFPNGDATKFAEHVFRTFDTDNDKNLDFREFMCALSITARGGPKDRLRWAFQMYDVDENGYISKKECMEIVRVCVGGSDSPLIVNGTMCFRHAFVSKESGWCRSKNNFKMLCLGN